MGGFPFADPQHGGGSQRLEALWEAPQPGPEAFEGRGIVMSGGAGHVLQAPDRVSNGFFGAFCQGMLGP